jgi:hypothetical protein
MYKILTHAHAYSKSRPKIHENDLRKDSGKCYNLDKSLFERLAESNSVKQCVLTTQRRMRPCIAELIRKTIYSDLKDHENVGRYPDVGGLSENLIFFDHDGAEDGGNDDMSRSFSNISEVKMIARFVGYLQRTEMGTKSITVLTPYAKQLEKLRYAHTHTYMCICIYIYIYIYTHIQRVKSVFLHVGKHIYVYYIIYTYILYMCVVIMQMRAPHRRVCVHI